jgi:hypothetical protein
VNAPHVFRAPRQTALPLDAVDPAVVALLSSLQTRIDLLQARVAGLEDSLASPPAVELLELAAYGWVQRLAATVAEEWGVSAAELVSARRTEILIRPRFALIWLMKQVSSMSLPQIGRLVGNRDHTTIMHALRRVEAWRQRDEVMRDITDRMLVIARRIHAEQTVKPAPTAPEGGEE